MMTDREEKIVSEILAENLQKYHIDGVLSGSRNMCKAVYDKATDETLTPEERLNDIIKFCKIALAQQDNKENLTE